MYQDDCQWQHLCDCLLSDEIISGVYIYRRRWDHLVYAFFPINHVDTLAHIRCVVKGSTVPYRTVPYRTVPYRTVPYRTVPYRTVPYRTVPYRTVPYRTVPYRTVPYRTVPYRTVPYRTVPYRTVPYRTVPYRTVPYRTVPYRSIYVIPLSLSFCNYTPIFLLPVISKVIEKVIIIIYYIFFVY